MTTQRLNLLAPGFRANPYPSYAELRRSSPVAVVDPAGLWAVSRYEDVASVIKNPQLYSSHGFKLAWEPAWVGYSPMANSMLAMDGTAHTRLRGLVSRAFNARAVQRLDARIQALAGRLADAMAARGEADFVSAFAMPLPAYVIGELLGLDVSLHSRFKSWTDDLASITPEPQSPEHAQRVRTTIADMTRYLGEVVEARRREPAEDLVTDLIRAEADGQALSDREVIDFLVLLVVAGLETTVHLLAHSLLFLSERPEELARLHAEPMLVPRFIEEMLRYDSPVQCVLRIATAESTLSGVTIPKGALVLALLGSANRDERHYPDPDRFDLQREQPALSFGHGPHFCIGSMLARMEARRGLEALLTRFRGFTRLSSEVTWNHSFTIRGPAVLPLRFTPA